MNAEIYKCFIASPSDTSEERSLCDTVFEDINKTLGEQLNFRIESKKWEVDAYPSFGEDGQAVVTEQLLDDFQLFIGIMWNTFGTPTKRAESGTEEEFNIAYKKHIEESSVEILLYFNAEPSDTDSLDLDQVQKVRDFKNKVSGLGGLYSKYNGANDFKEKLNKHISNYFIRELGAKTEDEVIINQSDKLKDLALKESISLVLKKRLDDSLSLFLNQPIVWVEPVISATNDISKNADDNYGSKIDIDHIISKPRSIIFKSPPQFGLTSLSNYMVSQAWEKGALWVYLDAEELKKKTPEKYVRKELATLNIEGKEIQCIILDSWHNYEPGSMKALRDLSHTFSSIPIIVMQTIDDQSFKKNDDGKVNRKFDVLHLLAMPRKQIRKVVSNYNNKKNICDENTLLDKVINELAVLNIHRTPVNCLTLLKVLEKNFDESPVNRTKMIEMVLFVLFDLEELPTYKAKPDLKDCEHVLGRFCEKLIRENHYQFTRESFLNELDLFCKDKLLELEVSVVFDVLYTNNIITKKGIGFGFRSTYWLYYFAARRMYFDTDFREYILKEQKYILFPEVIEFYTGIDRNRTDILEVLGKDLKDACDLVKKKTGLSEDINPLSAMKWAPSKETIDQIKDEIGADVKESKLPESLKDEYADKNYDQLKPYDQRVQSILADYSFLILIQKIKASSRALRNSDYVDPNTKRKLMKEIMGGWMQVSRLLFAMTPILAKDGIATFDGFGFYLVNEFGETEEEKISNIFLANPQNVMNLFKDDLSSNKIGPLIFDVILKEDDKLAKHILVLLLITEKPIHWKKSVENYIISLPVNSFYLYNTVRCLRSRYRYDFASDKELSELAFLLKMGLAKHEFNDVKPSLPKIKKISNNVLPKRENTE